MRVFVETTLGLERRLTVGVPAGRIEAEVDNRLRREAGRVRLNGFRPGKVPMKVVRQRFGPDVRREVLSEIIVESLSAALRQENLRPAGAPSVEAKTSEPGKDLEYVATFEVFPEIRLAELAGFPVERPGAEVTDADVERMVELFRQQQGGRQPVERPARAGDEVLIDYAGRRDGEPFAGGDGEGASLVLGSGRKPPGFEAGIEGMSAGDGKTIELSVPDDYHEAELRGASLKFEIALREVRELAPAPLDDALFARYGVEEGGEARFREEIAANMARELEYAIRAFVSAQVMDALYEAHRGQDAPKALIDREVGILRAQALQRSGAAVPAGTELEALLPAESFREQARRRVILSLVIAEFVARHGMLADSGRVRTRVEELASTYQQPREVVDWYYANEEQLDAVEKMVLEEQVVDKLLERATVTDRRCTYLEALGCRRGGQSA